MHQPTHFFRASLRRVAAVGALAAGLLLPWAAQADDWVLCASEGQTCHTQGPATVRFGANGRFEYRNVNGPIPCDPSTFGDPAKGAAKQCSYRMGHNAPANPPLGGYAGGSRWPGQANNNNNNSEAGWQTCAQEDGYCNFRGNREVRFGTAGSYTVRTANGGIDCHVRQFGDPAPGMPKVCQIRSETGWQGGSNRPTAPTDAGNWRFCAEEDQQCSPPRGATIRFGANGQYAYVNQARGSVLCHVNTFGDPAKGERKRCEYSVAQQGQNTMGGWLGQLASPQSTDQNWVYCAEEDRECRVPYPTVVRFGSGRQFHSLQVTSSVPCTPAVFGDPAKGDRKRCEYARQ